MIEYLASPLALVFFLTTWALAEEATFRRTMQSIREAKRAEPVVTPEVTPKRKGWIF